MFKDIDKVGELGKNGDKVGELEKIRNKEKYP